MAATHLARSMSLASFRAGHAVRVDAERRAGRQRTCRAKSRTGYPIDATARPELPTTRNCRPPARPRKGFDDGRRQNVDEDLVMRGPNCCGPCSSGRRRARARAYSSRCGSDRARERHPQGAVGPGAARRTDLRGRRRPCRPAHPRHGRRYRAQPQDRRPSTRSLVAGRWLPVAGCRLPVAFDH